MVFRSKMTQHPVRRKYKEYLSSLQSEITWEQVVSYWTKDGSDSLCVWQILEPLRLPNEDEEKEAVQKLRSLLTELLQAQDTPTICCGSHTHKTCVGSHDVLFIIYLASITEERRAEIVLNSTSVASKLTKEQLLNEAELIASAIEPSDQSTF
jgi:hypothetical protein